MAKLDGKVPAMPKTTSAYRSGPPVSPARDVSAALEMLASSHRPLIMLGNGCREAPRDNATYDALLHFVEARAIPVMTTADGKGVFPEDHELSLRAYGIANAIWPYYWLSQADARLDLLMVIGSGLGELATDNWRPLLRRRGPIIQIGANARIIARDFPVGLGICGEACNFIRRMARESGALPGKQDVEARKAKIADISRPGFADQAAYDSTSSRMHPAALCKAMQEVLSRQDSLVLVDAGTASAGRSTT